MSKVIAPKLRNLIFNTPENSGTGIQSEAKQPTDAVIQEILGEAILGEATTKADGIVVADGATGKLKNSNVTMAELEAGEQTIESGSATKLMLVWDNATSAYKSKTLDEVMALLIPVATPVNAVAASGILTAGDVPTATKIVTIGAVTYTFVEALSTEPEVANEILIEVSASLTLDNLINAINAGAGAGTKYGTGTVVHPTVSAAAGDGDTVNLTAKTKGVAGNSIATTTDDPNISFTGGATTLEGGVNGTVGDLGDYKRDTSYLYVAIAANTISDANWRRIALGSAY